MAAWRLSNWRMTRRRYWGEQEETKFREMTHMINIPPLLNCQNQNLGRSSLVPRPPRPAFVACNKSWACRPGNEARQEFMMGSCSLCCNELQMKMIPTCGLAETNVPESHPALV